MSTSQLSLQQAFAPEYLIDDHVEAVSPLVSIIIPTYNCLVYLPTAIRSIQKQNVNSLEIVILDDGSSDDTWQYLTLASACDRRIKAVKLPGGGGVAKARNHGLRLAKGDYIAFLDADDYWFSGKLSRQLAFHQQHPEVTLSFTNYLHFSPDNDDLGDCFGYWPRFKKHLHSHNATAYRTLGKRSTTAIFAENVIGTSCVMLNRKAIGAPVFFDETLKSAEDWDFWLNVSLRGPVGFTPSVDMAYLMRPGSETSRVQLRLQYTKVIMMRYLKPVLRSNPLAFLQSYAHLLTCYAEHYRSERRLMRSCCYHFFACVLSPSWRALKSLLADIKELVLHPRGRSSDKLAGK